MMFQNRGIKTQALLEAVENTAPFLFHEGISDFLEQKQYRYLNILRKAKLKPDAVDRELFAYFECALAAHFASVGTFVPTDVDLAIRLKLWQRVHQEKDFEIFWKWVLEFLEWDESLVSHRVVSLAPGLRLSGHQGEWFSVAMGAYGCALKIKASILPEVREAIERLVAVQEQALSLAFKNFETEATVTSMKLLLDGVAAVAHNLGDLDRMFEAWQIEDTDVLKRRVFRCGHEDARMPRGVFLRAGKIYQSLLAHENHRHFALREPKSLRSSARFLLNYGPFLDEWGMRLVKEGFAAGLLSEGDLRGIAEALIMGWARLNAKSIYHSQGYARALCGMVSAFPKGRRDLESLLPPYLQKEIQNGGLRTLMGVSKTQFELQWLKKLRGFLPESTAKS